MRRRYLVIACMLAFIAGPAVSEAGAFETYRFYAEKLLAHPPAGVVFRSDIETRLGTLASGVRKDRGRKPLEAKTALRAAARAQAIDILKTGSVGHRSARGDGFAVRFEAFGGDLEEVGARGENVLRGRRVGSSAAAQAAHLMKVWLGSSGHRRNLLAYEYRYVSTGVVQKGDTFYAVQIFWQR